MTCWKCGETVQKGANVCLFCGTSQKDRAPVISEIGRAMRILYDRYGAKEILTNNAYLSNGLGDLTEDSKKLRNQMKMALEAGVGKLYLEQLQVGALDNAFDARVKMLLTEDVGLNEKTAAAIAGYFDEMIGWRQPAAARPAAQPRTSDTRAREIDRSAKSAEPRKEIRRDKPQMKPVSPEPLPDVPVPKNPHPAAVVSVLSVFASALLAAYVYLPIFLLTIVLFFVMTGKIRKDVQVAKMETVRNGTNVVCTWTVKRPVDQWLIAVNGNWVAAGVQSPVSLPGVAQGAQVVLAYKKGKDILYACGTTI